MKTFTLSSRTHKEHTLSLCEYAVERPRAIVQVVHGMEEHKERYEDFSLFLNSCGYTVITADLCGHGSSVPKENLGFFCFQKFSVFQKNAKKFLISSYTRVFPCSLRIS